MSSSPRAASSGSRRSARRSRRSSLPEKVVDPDAYLKLKGAKDLDQRGWGVLRELYQMREAMALRLDRPPFMIVGNESLVALAAKRPRTTEDVLAVPGCSQSVVRRAGAAILDAVARGESLAADELPVRRPAPRPVFSAAVRRRAEALRAWRAKAAQDIALDPGVLFPQRVIDRLAADPPRDLAGLEQVEGVRRWRTDALRRRPPERPRLRVSLRRRRLVAARLACARLGGGSPEMSPRDGRQRGGGSGSARLQRRAAMTSDSRYVREGIIAGLIGAAIVAVWFLIYDAAQGRPLRTPALLGAATFQGVADPAAVPITTNLVVQYSVLHGVVFAMIGVLIAYLIVSSQREPSRLLILFIALMCFEVFFLAVIVWLAHPVLGELAWWSILGANALAALGMLVYFFVGHRALGRALLGPWTRVAREGAARGAGGRGRRRGVVPALRSRRRRAASAPRRSSARRSSTGCAIRARS